MRYLFTLLCSIVMFAVQAQPKRYEANWASLDSRPAPEWFSDAKFGIFIHWGLYSVPAWAPKGNYAEWYQYWVEGKGSEGQKELYKAFKNHHEQVYGKDFPYSRFGDLFKAEDFEPDEWAKLFEASGAKYVVLTAKHHDGFALWPSAEASNTFDRPWNSMVIGPKRDLAGDLFKAVKNTGLKMGFYYSLFEWFNPMYQQDKTRFVTEHFLPQAKDLVTRYNPDILWADGEWELTDEQWKSKELLAWVYNNTKNPDLIVNDRWGKEIRKHHGGFYTTEYGTDFASDHPGEECRGIGQSFVYNQNEDLQDYNSAQALILMLANVVSNGGNLLLDIGPTAGGKIPPLMQERLMQIGEWLKVNGEAIYDTHRWKVASQWSAGKRNTKPVTEGGVSGNFILKQTVAPDAGYAVKQAFFTRKNNTLYAVLPQLPKGQFVLHNVPVQKNTVITLLGQIKPLTWTKSKENIVIDFNGLTAKSPVLAYTLKINNVL
jgi:alpha-L-fucosidase